MIIMHLHHKQYEQQKPSYFYFLPIKFGFKFQNAYFCNKNIAIWQI